MKKNKTLFKLVSLLFLGLFLCMGCVSATEDINVTDKYCTSCGGEYKSLEVIGTYVEDGIDCDNINALNMQYGTSEDDFNNIGVPEDVAKNMEVYGEPPNIDENYILALESPAAGELHTLTDIQFEDAWNRITKWKNSHNSQWPSYVTIYDPKVGVDKIHKAIYLDMKKRWDNYIKTHNGQNPNIIGIEGPINSLSGVASSGLLKRQLMDAVGFFETFTGFYNKCKNRHYAFYPNDVYARGQAVHRLKNKSGLNCVDASQLGRDLAKEMGYQTDYKYIHCNKDNINHVYFMIKGHEFKSWTAVDLAACLDSGKHLGYHWCDGHCRSMNVNWLITDDGKT